MINGMTNNKPSFLQPVQNNPKGQVMSSNGAFILGDNNRDYKRYLEMERMSNKNTQIPQSNSQVSLSFYPPLQHNQHKRSETPQQSASHPQYQYTPQSTTDTNGNDITYLYSEIKNIKNMLKSSFENQSEIQSKVIEYNKVITEQENIIRMNNIKLNEHDSKLTEILLSFNNYLQLNDKSSKIVNDVQRQLSDCIKGNEFNELKSVMYTFNKSNENRINDVLHLYNDLKSRTEELTKENESYQKFSIERIKIVQREAMESRLQQQNDLIKMEESKEARLTAQMEQMRSLIQYLENNINSEANFRKTMVDNLRNEILSTFTRNDDKLVKLEKSQLETEKNLIYLNKDYMTSLQDLLTKQSEKHDIELKSLQSIIEAGLTKVDNKLDQDGRDYQESFAAVKASITDARSTMAELERFVKETINSIETKVEMTKGNNEDYLTKYDFLSKTLTTFMKENLELINSKTAETITTLENQIAQSISDFKLYHQMEKDQHDKRVYDLEEKVIELTNLFPTNKGKEIKLKADGVGSIPNIPGTSTTNNNKGDKSLFQDDPQVIKEYVESLCNERLSPIHAAFESFEKKLLGIVNMNIDDARNKLFYDQNASFEKLNTQLENRIATVQLDIIKQLKDEQVIIDGRMLEYLGESENRIKKKYDGELVKLKEDIDNLVLKFVPSMF